MKVSFLINTYYVILLPGLGGPGVREGAVSILVQVGNGGCEQHTGNRKGQSAEQSLQCELGRRGHNSPPGLCRKPS